MLFRAKWHGSLTMESTLKEQPDNGYEVFLIGMNQEENFDSTSRSNSRCWDASRSSVAVISLSKKKSSALNNEFKISRQVVHESTGADTSAKPSEVLRL